VVTLDVPAAMKMKRKAYDGGVELKNREVQMFVMELDDGTYRVRREGYVREPPPGWPRPPHLREERDESFRVGVACGLKLSTIRADSGLGAMSHYLLTVDGVRVEVSIFARGKGGCDFKPYEEMLGSLRVK
jgi:hypothetical protein